TMERLQAGKAFTLRDLYSQLQAVMNMGSMSKMLSMIPGMGGNANAMMSDEASIKRVKGFLVMMDSLTSAEMDAVKPIYEGSRIMRISRGSGHHPYAVIELIEEHKRMQKMLQRMGKTGLLSKAGDLTNMVRNPQQVINKLKASVDHDTLARMGGAENFFNMLKEMEQNEEMQALSKKLNKK
ncbi:hypothetical protein FOZ63_013905, partial [Perkinsus olseni]